MYSESRFLRDIKGGCYFVLILGFLVVSLLCLRRKRYAHITSKLPTVYGLPLLGIAHKLLPLERFLYQIDAYFQSLKTLTFCAWLGTDAYIITIDPDMIKTITSSAEFLNKANVLYMPINNAISDGIITSPVVKWKHNRKLMNAFLGHRTLLNFMSVFNRGADILVQRLSQLVGRGEQNVFESLKRITLEVAIETTMGVEMREDAATDQQLIDTFSFLMKRISQDAMYSTVGFGFLVRTPKYYKSLRFLHDYIRNLIQRMEESKHNPQAAINLGNNNDSFLQQALEHYAHGIFNEQDVINESLTMIAGSFETVSTAIYSALIMLAMHPNVQAKLSSEARTLLANRQTEFDYAHLKQTPYLDMVIAETLRLMPSIPVVGRQVVHDVKLTADLRLPKEMQVIIPIFNLHRCKSLWGADANEFNPEHFLPEVASKRHPYAYMPFSKGARMCIGWRYAEIALHVFLLKLARNFDFSTTFRYADLLFVDHISLCYKVEPKLSIKHKD